MEIINLNSQKICADLTVYCFYLFYVAVKTVEKLDVYKFLE